MGADLYGCTCFSGMTRVTGNIDIAMNRDLVSTHGKFAERMAEVRSSERSLDSALKSMFLKGAVFPNGAEYHWDESIGRNGLKS